MLSPVLQIISSTAFSIQHVTVIPGFGTRHVVYYLAECIFLTGKPNSVVAPIIQRSFLPASHKKLLGLQSLSLMY